MRPTTAYTYGSRILYGEPDVSFGGSEQFVPRPATINEFTRRITEQTIRPVFLVTLRVGQWLVGSVVDLVYGEHKFQPKILTPGLDQSSVTPGETYLAEQLIHEWAGQLPRHPNDDFNDWRTNGVAGSWFQSSVNELWFKPPEGKAVGEGTYRAIYTLRYANEPKALRGYDWRPRVQSVPSLSVRIDPVFGGVGQVGGGKLALNNGDGFFDKLDGLLWDQGELTLEMGIDLPAGDGDMDQADYRLLGTWNIEAWTKDQDEFILTLREKKNQLDHDIPHEVLARADYPTLDKEDIGRPVPRAYGRIYGAEPIVIDRALRRFKVAGHAIRSFDGVRIRRVQQEILEEDMSPALWEPDSGERWSRNESRSIKNVMFDGADLLEKNSIGEVGSTAGSWHQENQVLYVRPPSGETIDSGTWRVAYENQITAWVETNFEETDPHAAEFVLGSDWDRSQEVSVDFSGRVKSDGSLMSNGSDILADLLDYVGGIELDYGSFARARAYFHLGFDAYGQEKNVLVPSLYLDEARPARELVSELNAILGTYLFVDPAGVWRFEVFRPQLGQTLANATGKLPLSFDEKDVLSLRREVDNSELFSAVRLRYAPRLTEDWDQTHEERRGPIEFLHNLRARGVEEREVQIADKADARYLAGRILTTEAEPLVTYDIEFPWTAFFLLPGDQFRLEMTRYAMTDVLEVLEVKHDLSRARVKVRAGNRRGWEDTFGFWLADLSDYAGSKPVGPACELDPITIAGIPAQAVTLWEDSSGNGRHAYQNLPPQTPTYHPNLLNGQPGVKFEPMPQYLNFMVGFDDLAQAEIMAVVQAVRDPPTVTGLGSYLWLLGAGGVSEYPNPAGVIQEAFGSTTLHTVGDPTPPLTSPRLINVISTPTEFTYSLDITQLYTTATNTVGWPTLARIGRAAAGGVFDGFLYYLVIYPRKLTTPERDQLITLLSDRFGLGLVAASGPPPDWDPVWDAPSAKYARQNSGFWLDETNSNVPIADQDPRSARASRWW